MTYIQFLDTVDGLMRLAFLGLFLLLVYVILTFTGLLEFHFYEDGSFAIYLVDQWLSGCLPWLLCGS